MKPKWRPVRAIESTRRFLGVTRRLGLILWGSSCPLGCEGWTARSSPPPPPPSVSRTLLRTPSYLWTSPVSRTTAHHGQDDSHEDVDTAWDPMEDEADWAAGNDPFSTLRQNARRPTSRGRPTTRNFFKLEEEEEKNSFRDLEKFMAQRQRLLQLQVEEEQGNGTPDDDGKDRKESQDQGPFLDAETYRRMNLMDSADESSTLGGEVREKGSSFSLETGPNLGPVWPEPFEPPAVSAPPPTATAPSSDTDTPSSSSSGAPTMDDLWRALQQRQKDMMEGNTQKRAEELHRQVFAGEEAYFQQSQVFRESLLDRSKASEAAAYRNGHAYREEQARLQEQLERHIEELEQELGAPGSNQASIPRPTVTPTSDATRPPARCRLCSCLLSADELEHATRRKRSDHLCRVCYGEMLLENKIPYENLPERGLDRTTGSRLTSNVPSSVRQPISGTSINRSVPNSMISRKTDQAANDDQKPQTMVKSSSQLSSPNLASSPPSSTPPSLPQPFGNADVPLRRTRVPSDQPRPTLDDRNTMAVSSSSTVSSQPFVDSDGSQQSAESDPTRNAPTSLSRPSGSFQRLTLNDASMRSSASRSWSRPIAESRPRSTLGEYPAFRDRRTPPGSTISARTGRSLASSTSFVSQRSRWSGTVSTDSPRRSSSVSSASRRAAPPSNSSSSDVGRQASERNESPSSTSSTTRPVAKAAPPAGAASEARPTLSPPSSAPRRDAWIRVEDPDTNEVFFWNEETEEMRWDL